MKKLWLVGIGLSITLTGCGLMKKEKPEYVTAEESKPLKLPKKSQKNTIVDFYVIPKVRPEAKRYPVGEKLKQSAPLTVIADGNDVRSVYDSKDAAVWIEQPKKSIKANLQSFLKRTGIKYRPVKGGKLERYETAWHIEEFDRSLDPVFDGEVEEVRNRFAITFKPSDRNREMLVSVAVIDSAVLLDDKWQKSDPSASYRDFQLINEFIQARQEGKNTRERGSAYQSIGLKMAIAEDKQAVFRADAPFRRTFIKLESVLEELDFDIEDKDASDGLIVASFDYDGQTGFFDWLFGATREILELPTGTYRFRVKSFGQDSEIRVLDNDGKFLDAKLIAKMQPRFTAIFRKKLKK